MEEPTIGSIVHFVNPDDDYYSLGKAPVWATPGQHSAAIVTSVNGTEGSVNLAIFHNGPGMACEMEVPFSDGHEKRTWHWPERIKNP